MSSRCFHYHFHCFLTADSCNTILLQSSYMPKHATPDRREQINQTATSPSKVCRPRRPGHFSLRTADVTPRSSQLRYVKRGGTSASQRQKFHTDGVNQCLHNKSGSHGVPNANLINSTFLLVDIPFVSVVISLKLLGLAVSESRVPSLSFPGGIFAR